MNNGNVIAFQIVVNVDLPVAVNIPVFRLGQLHAFKVSVAYTRGYVFKKF